MKIKINDIELELHYGYNELMLYENMTQESVDYSNFKISNLVHLFYACILGACLRQKISPILTYDEYRFNWIDEHKKELEEFCTFVVNQVTIQDQIIPKSTKSKKTKEKTGSDIGKN